MCDVFGSYCRGYYDWASRDLSLHGRLTQESVSSIYAISANHQQLYCVARIAKTLHHEGVWCSENPIA